MACPHYTAEIVIYASMFATAPSIPSALMLVFVLVNLSQSGRQAVDWYAQKFGPHLAPGEMRYAILKHVL